MVGERGRSFSFQPGAISARKSVSCYSGASVIIGLIVGRSRLFGGHTRRDCAVVSITRSFLRLANRVLAQSETHPLPVPLRVRAHQPRRLFCTLADSRRAVISKTVKARISWYESYLRGLSRYPGAMQIEGDICTHSYRHPVEHSCISCTSPGGRACSEVAAGGKPHVGAGLHSG